MLVGSIFEILRFDHKSFFRRMIRVFVLQSQDRVKTIIHSFSVVVVLRLIFEIGCDGTDVRILCNFVKH